MDIAMYTRLTMRQVLHSRRLATIALAVVLPLATSTAQDSEASTAQNVLALAREAMGGESRLAAVKTLTIAGTYIQKIDGDSSSENKDDAVSQRTGERQITLSLPDRFVIEDEIPLQAGFPSPTSVECVEGNRVRLAILPPENIPSGVSMNFPAGPPPDAARQRKARFEAARYLIAVLLGSSSAFPVAFTYKGEAEAPDGLADMLNGTGPDGFEVNLFLDKKTHMPLMMSYKGYPQSRMLIQSDKSRPGSAASTHAGSSPGLTAEQAGKVETGLRLGDYRKTSGLLLPYLLTWNENGKLREQFEVRKYGMNIKANLSQCHK